MQKNYLECLEKKCGKQCFCGDRMLQKEGSLLLFWLKLTSSVF